MKTKRLLSLASPRGSQRQKSFAKRQPTEKMTLAAHFRELKIRVVYSGLFFVAAFALGFFIAPYAGPALTRPLLAAAKNAELIYTGIYDGLSIQFSLAGLFAILFSAPFLIYQAFGYVAPALKKNERRVIIPMLFASPVLFLSGAAFAYFILLPIMFEFMAGIADPNIRLLPDMKNYLAFGLNILRAFGVAFQLPLVLILLNRTGVLSRMRLMRAARYVIVGIFVLAAVLTPPDLLSLIVLALPLTGLFFASFLFMRD